MKYKNKIKKLKNNLKEYKQKVNRKNIDRKNSQITMKKEIPVLLSSTKKINIRCC